MGGVTSGPVSCASSSRVAAMEPAADGRGDDSTAEGRLLRRPAAMEPAADGRGDAYEWLRYGIPELAAMEPAADGRGDVPIAAPS